MTPIEVDLTIDKIIPKFCEVFEVDKSRIGCGCCFYFAYCLYKIVGGELCTYYSNKKRGVGHAFLKYNNYFFDDSSPFYQKHRDLTNWRMIFPSFQIDNILAKEQRYKKDCLIISPSEQDFIKVWKMNTCEIEDCLKVVKWYQEKK